MIIVTKDRSISKARSVNNIAESEVPAVTRHQVDDDGCGLVIVSFKAMFKGVVDSGESGSEYKL